MKNIISFLYLFIILTISVFSQDVPSEVNIQGKILNGMTPVQGLQTLDFSISNGVTTPTWTQSNATTLTDGVYSTSINTNSLNPIPDAMLLNGNPQMTISIAGTTVGTYELESVLTALIARRALNGVPINGIIMYSGSVDLTCFDATGLGVGEMTGWALCNGSNTTPDLKGRFIAGYDPAVAAYNTIGDTGGTQNVTLTAAQSGLPAHTHGHTLGTSTDQHVHYLTIPTQTGVCGTSRMRGGTGCSNGSYSYWTDPNSHSHIITGTISTCPAQNAATPFDNRPPYYTLAYIKRLQ